MKVTVSIPDDLWDAVRDPNEGPSHIVQKALRLLKARDAGSFPNAPEGMDLSSAHRSVERLVEQAEVIRRRGYEVGIRLAERLTNWVRFENGFVGLGAIPNRMTVEQLATFLFVEDVEGAFDVPGGSVVDFIGEAFGDSVDESESGVAYRGVAQALLDIYDGVRERLERPNKRDGGEE